MKYVKIILSMLLLVSVFFGNIGSTLAQENELKNGEYTINFSFLYKGAPSNHMDNYIVKPATLFVKNGNKDIQLTLKNASVIAGFTVNGKEPEVVSNDGENRVIKFSVSDLSKMEDVLISVKAGAYESKYEMQMQFDTASITAVNVPKEEKPEVEKPNKETEQPKEDEPIVTGPSDQVVKLADGEYTANFNTINTNSADASSMASYFENPATVKVKNGKQYIYLKIVKGSSMIPYLEIEKSGAFTKMEEVSTDGDTRIVRFEAENVGKVMKANVYVSAGAYQKTYDFRFVFDTTSIQAVKQDTTEEKPSGEKPSGEVKEEENTLPGLKNGVYSLPFVFLVDGKETDKMDNNIQNPAQLTVKDGKNYVSITLKGTNTLTGFKVEKNKKFVEPTVLSSTNNSKVVQFEVADLEKLLNVKVKIDIAEINYHHEYTLQMKFDTANLLSGSKDKTENDLKEESGTGTVKDNDTNAEDTTNNTQVEEDNKDKTPEFDRESEKEKDPSTTSSDKVKNSQTFDNAQLGMYLALLVGSLLGLVRRYRTRLLQ